MQRFYLVLSILGFILPYGFFVTWLLEHGFNISLIFEAITASNLSLFAWVDVLISAIVLIRFIQVDGKRQGIKKLYLPIIATCTVGVSLGLPLYLYMREINTKQKRQTETA